MDQPQKLSTRRRALLRSAFSPCPRPPHAPHKVTAAPILRLKKSCRAAQRASGNPEQRGAARRANLSELFTLEQAECRVVGVVLGLCQPAPPAGAPRGLVAVLRIAAPAVSGCWAGWQVTKPSCSRGEAHGCSPRTASGAARCRLENPR